MTSERTTGQASDVTDARVSGAYRELARERVPASVNERVLREARAHAGGGYSYWISWLRPAAWVATVGLCLAIVVELTSTQYADVPRSDLPSLAPAPEHETRVAAPEPGDSQPMSDGAARKEGLRQQSPARGNESGGTPPGPRLDDRAEPTGLSLPQASNSDAIADGERFRITDAPIVQTAEEMARMREGPVQSSSRENARRPAAVRAAGSVAAAPDACDDRVRTDSEAWIECIRDIERHGGDASEEREKFKAAFPDVELP